MADIAERTRHAFAPLTDFIEGKFVIREMENRSIGVVRLKDGQFRAVLNWCPHKGAPVCRGIVGGTWLPSEPGELVYDREGEVLACPWHGFEYDVLTGRELIREKPTHLRFYETEVEDGQVYVIF